MRSPGTRRPLTAHVGAELVAAGKWRPRSAGATIELSHIIPLREEDADGEVDRTGCASPKHDVRGDRCARQARACRRGGDQRPGADRVPEAAAGDAAAVPGEEHAGDVAGGDPDAARRAARGGPREPVARPEGRRARCARARRADAERRSWRRRSTSTSDPLARFGIS